MAVTGLVLAVLFTLMAIFAPLIAPYGPGETDFAAPLAGPSADHLLGTDELGPRHVLAHRLRRPRVDAGRPAGDARWRCSWACRSG